MISKHSIRAAAAIAGLSALIVSGGLAGTSPAQVAAAQTPSACTAAPVAASSSPEAAGAAAAIPTQAAIEQEVNPPGDIPDNQAFVAYISSTGGYSISMPEGWERTENGPNVQFADKLHVFSVDLGCWSGPLTVDTVQANQIPALAAQIPAFGLVDVQAVTLPAGDVILIQYRTNSEPDAVTGKQHRLDVDRYELVSNSRLVSISLAAPAGSDNVDVSRLVSESFRWTA
jgi:hypothetical protein